MYLLVFVQSAYILQISYCVLSCSKSETLRTSKGVVAVLAKGAFADLAEEHTGVGLRIAHADITLVYLLEADFGRLVFDYDLVKLGVH